MVEPLEAQTISNKLVDKVYIASLKETKMMLLAPIVKDRKGEHFTHH